MLYHCGLLDDDPLVSRSYRWMMRRGWYEPEFPADVFHEIAVWFNMPGFDLSFHTRNFQISTSEYYRHKARLPDFEAVRASVTENWLSTTRDDCLRIAALRRGPEGIPLLVQLSILDDLKAQMSIVNIARAYGVTTRSVDRIKAQMGPRGLTRQHMPAGFELLLATS